MLSALRHHRRLVLAFFLLAAAFLYLAHIGSYHLIELDEGRYHRIPMEMVLSGDYLTPHFDYMPYFEKPILQYWVTALAMKIFGFKEFTGRVLPALTGFGNVLLAYVLGRSMYNGRTGLMAAIILATSALQLIVASIGVLDMALTFFVDACLVTFYLFERTEVEEVSSPLLYRHGPWHADQRAHRHRLSRRHPLLVRHAYPAAKTLPETLLRARDLAVSGYFRPLVLPRVSSQPGLLLFLLYPRTLPALCHQDARALPSLVLLRPGPHCRSHALDGFSGHLFQ